MRSNKPGATPTNPASEQQFRHALLKRAKTLGCDGDLKLILEKFDKALANCTNEVERRHIAQCGAAEIHLLFGCRGGLVINGQTVIPPEPGSDNGSNGKILKI